MSYAVLWGYPNSSASYCVRIALNLAGLPYRTEIVSLLGGFHKTAGHLGHNPQGLLPVLDIDGRRLSQSRTILEYLDRTRNLHLWPDAPALRAKAQALAMTLALDVQPLGDLSPATNAAQGAVAAKPAWMRPFIRPVLETFESQLASFSQHRFSVSDSPSLPDLHLIPQLYNAGLWGVHYDDLARICAVQSACAALPAFAEAAPKND